MRESLLAVQDALAAIGVVAHLLDAGYEPRPPYYVVAPATYGRPQVSLRDTTSDAEFPCRVTSVAGTTGGALDMAQRARDTLSPGYGARRLVGHGRVVESKFSRHEVSGVDDSVTIPGTGRHPAYSVDTFDIVGRPA